MKNDEIPQDGGALEKADIQELYYVTDKKGKYTTGVSTGWETKTLALEKCLEYEKELIAQAKEDVLQGKVSPIVYYMEKTRMDWITLADYMNTFTWLVKLHTKPFIFKRLKEKTLMKYAKAFDVSLNKLKNI